MTMKNFGNRYSPPTQAEWEEYWKRRKELSLSAERYRVEIRALKERIRQLETFLLYLPSGGSDEKDAIDYRAASDPESFGFCERGGPTDACSGKVSGSGLAAARDEMVRVLAECIAKEREYTPDGSGGQGRDLSSDASKVRSGWKEVGIIHYGEFAFPILRGPDAMDCVEDRRAGGGAVDGENRRHTPDHSGGRDCWATGCNGQCEEAPEK